MAVGYTSSSPAAISMIRSSQLVRRNIQPGTPQASAAMPANAVAVTCTTFQAGPSSRSPMPERSSTKANGTRKAGNVYFQDCSVVLYGSPPVMAAAANGDSAVGGDTSESTA